MKIETSNRITSIKIMTFYMYVTLFPSSFSNAHVATTVLDYTASNAFSFSSSSHNRYIQSCILPHSVKGFSPSNKLDNL